MKKSYSDDRFFVFQPAVYKDSRRVSCSLFAMTPFDCRPALMLKSLYFNIPKTTVIYRDDPKAS